MNSQVHRDEILNPHFTQVGVGAYWAGNVLYVTEVFRLPEQAAAAPARRAAPAPARVVTRTVAAPAPAAAKPAVAPAPPTTAAAPPTTAAPPSTSTSLVAAAAPQWPAAALNTQRAASHASEGGTPLSALAVVAAVLLMLVAGVEVHTLRR